MQRPIKRVAVIGAGAAGLAATRRLMDTFEVVVFERSSKVGGTWDFTMDQGEEVHSSMYRDLHTNLPKQIMAFPGFPFTQGKETFVHHTDVQAYLEAFSAHFNINQLVHFNTAVDNVSYSGRSGEGNSRSGDVTAHSLASSSASDTTASCESASPDAAADGAVQRDWTVTVRNLQTGTTQEMEFDAVAVCNGHYTAPIIPAIPGLQNFGGQILHSHTYRMREPFEGKRVVCLGGGQSGRDISQELCSVSRSVVLSHRYERRLGEDPLVEKPPIKEIDAAGEVVFEDGSRTNADVLIFCTGYRFTFPFLDPSCDVRVDEQGRVVSGLYHQVFNISHPSMAFVGLPVKVLPFPLFDLQCQWMRAVWSGAVSLPTQAEMREEEAAREAQRRKEGVLPRYHHVLAEQQWQYNSNVARMAGVAPLEPWREAIYHRNNELRSAMPWHYKHNTFDLAPDGSWSVRVYNEDVEGSNEQDKQQSTAQEA